MTLILSLLSPIRIYFTVFLSSSALVSLFHQLLLFLLRSPLAFPRSPLAVLPEARWRFFYKARWPFHEARWRIFFNCFSFFYCSCLASVAASSSSSSSSKIYFSNFFKDSLSFSLSSSTRLISSSLNFPSLYFLFLLFVPSATAAASSSSSSSSKIYFSNFFKDFKFFTIIKHTLNFFFA